MEKIALNKQQVQDLVWDNRFKLDKKQPETNIDELTLLMVTGESYGFEVDKEKSARVINEIFNSQKKPAGYDKRYEGAVLQIRGEYSVNPLFSLRTEGGKVQGELFIFHETLTSSRHKNLARKLVEKKAVKLFPGCDAEYLYEALTETTEIQLFETLKRLAAGLPIFLVSFDEAGGFEIKEMGKINNSE